MRRCGVLPMTSRSLKAPGSDSSALMHEVRRLSGVLREERRLAPHREACASSPAQRRRADLVHQGLRLHPASLVERRVAADRAVLVEPRQVVLLGSRREQDGASRVHAAPRGGRRRLRDEAARGRRGRRRRPELVRSRRRTRSREASPRRPRWSHPAARRARSRNASSTAWAPGKRARQVGAHLDHVLPHRLQVVHVVEGRDRVAERRASRRARPRLRAAPRAAASRRARPARAVARPSRPSGSAGTSRAAPGSSS